jgi:ribonuclease P/MRP protein subunit RPP1
MTTTSRADQAARKIFFGNAANLVRVSRGRNLILSSQATRALSLRSPYDVATLYVQRTTVALVTP